MTTQLKSEKFLFEKKQLSSCSLFNQFMNSRPIFSFHKHISQANMGQVDRSSQISLSFWFTLDNQMFNDAYPEVQRNGQQGKSGKISLLKVLNPRHPMKLGANGEEYFHKVFGSYEPCPFSKVEILNDPSLLEIEKIRNNPNCVTNGLESLLRQRQALKTSPEVAPFPP